MTATLDRPSATVGSLSSAEIVRRRAAGLAAIIAPWGFVIANGAYTWATRNGGSDETGVGTIQLYASVPGLVRLAVVAASIGCLLIVPAVAGAIRLAPRSWLALIGGALVAGGYIGYFGVLNTNILQLAMAEHGGAPAGFAAAIDAAQADSSMMWVFLLFVAGNLLGTILLAIGLLHSKALPVGAAVLIMCWPVSHVLGLSIGTEIPEVIGAVLQAIGFAVLGVRIARPDRRLGDNPQR